MDKIIILSNTIIDRDSRMILERDPDKMDVVKLYVPGLEPHVFEGNDARELWKFYDRREPGWREVDQP